MAVGTNAQNITGRVLDAETLEPLPFANVFLNNTTTGTVTDIDGQFNISSIKEPGTYELVFSFVGYQLYKMKVTIGESPLSIGSIKLIPSETQLSTVEVTSTRDKEWEKKLKKFKKIFFGEDKLAASCSILNPWVVDFPPHDSKFIATATAPLEIENNAMGYKINFYLTGFWSDANEYSITGHAFFTELLSKDEKKINDWEENRIISYRKSAHYLFKSMIEQRIYGEGFSLYGDKENLKNAITRSSLFYAQVGKTVFEYDTLGIVVPDTQPGYYKITLKGRVEVHDRKEKATQRIYQDVFGMVSWVTLRNNQVIVNKDGFPKNPADVIVSGDMGSARMASMLPLDYKPGRSKYSENTSLSRYQEQIYVHTDKPYYYPGETIWYKGYINYTSAQLKDSLSRTVYVELIDRDTKRILQARCLPVINRSFSNNFKLADSISAKNYYLRAYTNFNRNFGDENLYVKLLPVINLTEKVSTSGEVQKETIEGLISVQTDKKEFKTREKITLTIRVLDDDGKPVATNLSISVTDSGQVIPIKVGGTIIDDFPLKALPAKQDIKDIKFPVEYGIPFSGRFLNNQNKPEKATLNVFLLNPKSYALTQSDEKGIFTVSDLSFYDTAALLIQASAKDGTLYGRGEWIERETPAINFKVEEELIETAKMESVQRINSGYETPKDAILLKTVEVKSTRIEEENQPGYRVKRPYGKPDYVIEKKDINAGAGNLLQIIPGKIPGLIVRRVNLNGQDSRWVVYIERGGNNGSLKFPKEVIVTVNNQFVGGTPEEILSTIDPATVESIEVSTSVNVLYGASGGNGIVSIYTNTEIEQAPLKNDLLVMKVPGYSSNPKISFPEYGDLKTDRAAADYRSLVYWNPDLFTDDKTGNVSVYFYAADLPGRYRIIIEGITQEGEPLRIVHYIEITD